MWRRPRLRRSRPRAKARPKSSRSTPFARRADAFCKKSESMICPKTRDFLDRSCETRRAKSSFHVVSARWKRARESPRHESHRPAIPPPLPHAQDRTGTRNTLRLFTGNRSTRRPSMRTRITSILHPISAAIGCGKAGNRRPERKRISPTAGKGLFKPEYQRAFMPQCGQLR